LTGSDSGDCFSGDDNDSGLLLVCELAEPLVLLLLLVVVLLLLLLLLLLLMLLLLLLSRIGVTTELTEG
jgi:hypothetical protein